MEPNASQFPQTRLNTLGSPAYADADFAGKQKFTLYSPSGGQNHFFADNHEAGMKQATDAINSVGKTGTWGVGFNAGDDGPKLGGASIFVNAPHPGDKDQRNSITVNHEGYKFRPDSYGAK